MQMHMHTYTQMYIYTYLPHALKSTFQKYAQHFVKALSTIHNIPEAITSHFNVLTQTLQIPQHPGSEHERE